MKLALALIGTACVLTFSTVSIAANPPPAVQQSGSIPIGDCPKTVALNVIGDSGVSCSGGVVNPTALKLGAPPTPANVDCNGDSLSYGYCAQLQQLMAGVVNNAVAGNSPFQIAARMGALPITLTSSTGYVGSGGGDAVTVADISPLNGNGPSGGVTGTWQGTHGTLTLSAGVLTFTADTAAQKPALNPAPFIIDTTRTYQRRVVWMGHNVSQQPSTTIAGTWGFVAANTPPNTQLLFLLNTYDLAAGDLPGGNFGAYFKQLNNYVKNTFANTLDPTPILQAGANSSFPPDAADLADGTEPSSLRLLDGIGTLTSSISSSATSIPITVTSGSMVAGDEIVVENGTNAESMLSTAATGATGSLTATVLSRPCSSTIGSCSPALAHSSGATVYILNTIHFDSTADGSYIAAQSSYQSNFPAANRVGGYNLIAQGVYNWFAANAPPVASAPTQTADVDGQLKTSAGLVPTSTAQSILGTLAKPYQSVTASNLQVPGALKCAYSGIGGECDIPNLYATNAIYIGGSPYNPTANYWFGCYTFAGTNYCTPVNGAHIIFGNSSNSFYAADFGNLSFFAGALTSDTNGAGVLGGLSSGYFNAAYVGATVSVGTHFTVSGSSAGAPLGGADTGTFIAGTTGANSVTWTSGGQYGAVAAKNGWACVAQDTTNQSNVWSAKSASTTTATLTGNATSGDVIQVSCRGY